MARGRSPSNETREPTARDANGTVLRDDDTVTLIKDLKVRGTSSVLKMGTKIKQIRIVDGDHDIDCKTDLGPMMLKSEFLKKS
jgi:protein PhnA